MSSTYSPSLRIELIATGQQVGTWGSTTNNNLGDLIESAVCGYTSIAVSSANQAFTALNGAPDEARHAVIALTTSTSAAFSVYAPPAEKTYVIANATAYDATIYNSTVIGNTTAAGSGITIPAGKTMTVWTEGTNFYLQNTHFVGTVVGNVTGNVTGNADTVTDGVYTTGDQTIAGVKTFSSSPIIPDATTTGQPVTFGQLNAAAPAVASIVYVASNSVPTGYLRANGAAVSRSTYANLFDALVTTAGFTSQTFTVTIASPAVFTKNAHGFNGGERIRLSTTGALPTGLDTTTDYYVKFVSANTFEVALTPGGASINTSGTQSGTQSYLQSLYGLGDGSTTFNVPDLRGEFLRGWDDGRTVDTGRTLGATQLDQMQKITGTFRYSRGSTASGSGAFSPGAGGGNGADGGGNNQSIDFDSAGSPNARVSSTTDGETRARNVAMLACIKF